MKQYHTRHPDQAITDPDEILELLRNQRLITLAMSMENEPYLVTVNYAFDEEASAFYFHCATKGKKIDFLRANPVVWCQVLEDRGYVHNECQHRFSTVQFRGKAEIIEGEQETRATLARLIEFQEKQPDPVKERFLEDVDLKKVMMRITPEEFSGKKGE